MQSGGTVESRYLRIGGILAIIAATQWIIGGIHRPSLLS